ncbi:MAG: RnfABCDGE type electron transport complex subunit B [Candidatus Hydrogenedens sp.]|jgi:RnfABCDGE-type electron transport complex B subunit|nr:RnfABCDGE type electron transport complex subunit B [Candidatus Hydrogenedens sp.]
MSALIIAGAVMLVLGLLLAAMLAAANKKLYVYEDPRIDEVEAQLPAANCGACGFAGCRAFAEAVIRGEATPGQCTASSAEIVESIAEYLGVDAGVGEKHVARLACAGGDDVAKRFAHYEGRYSCRAASLVAGGGKHCTFGCIGYGDCVEVCPFDALHLNEHLIPVVDEDKCTACGNCVTECPKNLFSIQPISNKLWVACATRLRGRDAKQACAVACIGCGLCAKAAPEAVSMDGNLPVVDYDKNEFAVRDAIEVCPSGAICWLEDGERIIGEKAQKALDKWFNPPPKKEKPAPEVAETSEVSG